MAATIRADLLTFSSQLPSMPITMRIWELAKLFHILGVQKETCMSYLLLPTHTMSCFTHDVRFHSAFQNSKPEAGQNLLP